METFTPESVLLHNKESDAYVIYQDLVVDITSFLDSHPGGKEYLLPYLGKDITTAYQEIEHSNSAMKILLSHAKGSISGTKRSECPGSKYDLNKGLIYQVWKSISLEDYKELVNNPMHVEGHVKLFDSPLLEMFTKTYWWLIPLLWGPVAMLFVIRGFIKLGIIGGMGGLVSGLLIWTLLEYILHRFVFHSEERIPDSRWWITSHFLIHGIHHAFPADNLRLVFPPALAAVLAVLLKSLYDSILPENLTDILFAGTGIGYIIYDVFHYHIHHISPSNPYIIYMKAYHMHHHYKIPTLGFGVSNKLWDIILDTELHLTYQESLKYAYNKN